jgi:amidohydrolase
MQFFICFVRVRMTRKNDECPAEFLAAHLADLVALRRALHAAPELAGQEAETADRLKRWLASTGPRVLHERVGGFGLLAEWGGGAGAGGPVVVARADLDALPIPDRCGRSYASTRYGVGHVCGHDAHMAMVAGLAPLLHRFPPRVGRVALLFQGAEETGEGASAVIADSRWQNLSPGWVFALHVLPGFPLGQVLVRPGAFHCASRGLILRFHGRSAHAAEPEHGRSPAGVMCRLVRDLPGLPARCLEDRFGLVTVVHAGLGAPAFGTAPGDAVVMATLRAATDADLGVLWQEVLAMAEALAAADRLEVEWESQDDFPACINSVEAVEQAVTAAGRAGLSEMVLEQPLRVSEDFAWYGRTGARSAMIGLGIGEQGPRLHNPEFDAPDEVLPIGVRLWWEVLGSLVGLPPWEG